MVSCLPQILKGTKCQCFLKIALDSSTKELWILEFLKYLVKQTSASLILSLASVALTKGNNVIYCRDLQLDKCITNSKLLLTWIHNQTAGSYYFENHVGFFSDLPKPQAIFLSDSQFRRRGRYVAGCWLFNYKVEIFEIVRLEYVF